MDFRFELLKKQFRGSYYNLKLVLLCYETLSRVKRADNLGYVIFSLVRTSDKFTQCSLKVAAAGS